MEANDGKGYRWQNERILPQIKRQASLFIQLLRMWQYYISNDVCMAKMTKSKKPWLGLGACTVCVGKMGSACIEKDGIRVWCGNIVTGMVLGYGVIAMVLGI